MATITLHFHLLLQFLVQLHLPEVLLLALSLHNLLLHLDLSLEVLLLELAELADSHQLSFVPRESFAHGELVLIAGRTASRLRLGVCTGRLGRVSDLSVADS